MSLPANARLFARKGEASPAGVTHTQFPAEKPCAPGEIEGRRGDAAGRAGASDGAVPMSLSFLIQRNTGVVAKASFGEDRECAAIAPARAETAKRRRSRSEPARDPQPEAVRSTGRAPAREPAANTSHAGGEAGGDTWHKLSFRVRQDQYRKLKALSGLWGASFQGILERAVAAFVDSAIGDETEWDA